MNFLSKMLLCLMISFTLVEFPITKAHAQAGMITTSEVITEMSRTQADQTVSSFLNRTEVQAQLIKLGLSAKEAQRRLATLSDAEAKKLAQDMNSATAGGDAVGILVVVLIVLMIIYFAKRI
jgi:hypothetical protein